MFRNAPCQRGTFVHTGRLFVLSRHKRGVNAKHAMAANSGESWCPDRLVSRSLDISPAFRDTVASSHNEAILFWRVVEDRLSSQRNLSVAKNTRISASFMDWALDCGHCETGKDGQSEPVQGTKKRGAFFLNALNFAQNLAVSSTLAFDIP